MSNSTAREKIEEAGYEDVLIFESPSYDQAFLGVTTDGLAVYDYDEMVTSLVEEDGMDYDEAADFVSYNTIRACDYTRDAPIIVYRL